MFVRTLLAEGDDSDRRPSDRARHHRPVPLEQLRRRDKRDRCRTVAPRVGFLRGRPKVCGIETEYGVALRGAADANPVLASSMLINAYVEHRKVGWDFEDESPGRDARGFAREGSAPPEIETHLVNTVLTNGARYYVDHAHPEYSTPECADAPSSSWPTRRGSGSSPVRCRRRAACSTRPGDRRLQEQLRRQGQLVRHARELSRRPHRAVRHARPPPLPWFVTRQVFTGAGKVGGENGAAHRLQISQRADFFEEEVGLETTLKRPIVNTRDEPHADPQKYRRLHVIVGDAQPVRGHDVPEGRHDRDRARDDRGRLHRQGLLDRLAGRRDRTVSHDPTCRATVELAEGRHHHRRRPAMGVPTPRAEVRRRRRPRGAGREEIGHEVLGRWEATLEALERDPLHARRPARLGHEARRCSTPTASATRSSGTIRSSRCSTCSTTTCAPPISV